MMTSSQVFYPFHSLDDLADCRSGTTKFCTISLTGIASCGDTASAAEGISTWLANIPTSSDPNLLHAWPSKIPITALYYVWRALRDGLEHYNLVFFASRALQQLRQLLGKTAQHELRGSSQPRARQHNQQDSIPQPQRDKNACNDQTWNQEQTDMQRESHITAQIDTPSVRWQLQEGAKMVCFFAAQLMILAGTPASAAGDSLAADSRGGGNPVAVGGPAQDRSCGSVRGRSGRGRGRQGGKGVGGRGGRKPGACSSAGGARLARALDSGSIDAWAEALQHAAGCLDDVGQLVWVHGLQFGSVMEARAVTEVRGRL
ncbi:hypothetical protein Vafri_12199 [Volvox africanus]|uniref:Uncharacterized protein n=1 Tax=Volvox africanus TaxID=51714 RepID=A0A8J4F473_9CHLO|nr:hypothetical protein Vafri_12199 [Volvox africanus]